MNDKKYFSVDFRISIFTLEAVNHYHAEAIMHKWVDSIAPIMSNKVCWDEVDWTIKENVFDEAEGIWVTTTYDHN